MKTSLNLLENIRNRKKAHLAHAAPHLELNGVLVGGALGGGARPQWGGAGAQGLGEVQAHEDCVADLGSEGKDR